jgi:hypothetical protein
MLPATDHGCQCIQLTRDTQYGCVTDSWTSWSVAGHSGPLSGTDLLSGITLRCELSNGWMLSADGYSLEWWMLCITMHWYCWAINVVLPEDALPLLGNECCSSQMMLLLLRCSECCTARHCYSFRWVVKFVLLQLLSLLLSCECCWEPTNQPTKELRAA